ncbi:MAG: DUF1343 domain-containing protein [Planctomycetota bacterium]|nr:DUF1343 domain-containing protein [Planctomycetota bacterium]
MHPGCLPVFVLSLCCLALSPAVSGQAPVRSGADQVATAGNDPLRGRKCGLITNHTGLTQDGKRTIDVLFARDDVDLKAIFSPEHGITGKLDQSEIGHGTDQATGLPIWSLYAEKSRRPTARMLEGLDTLVFDIQDIGCRFYTYISTMGICLEAAAEHGMRFVVLDRPNPIDGVQVAGPLLDAGSETFVGYHRIPVRHAMTVGELMQLFVADKDLQVDAQVVPCQGWTRPMTFDETGLTWVNPSPNMRSLTEALLYPGIGLLEGTNLSVGRGTDTPFEILGAPWCDGPKLWRKLQEANLPGVSFVPTRFTPDASKFKNQECGGIQIAITDRSTFAPIATGLTIACALRDLFPEDWKHERLNWLLRNRAIHEAFAVGAEYPELHAMWQAETAAFAQRCKPYLIYR